MKQKDKLFIWLSVVIVAICAAYFFVMFYLVPVNMEKRGQFGDMFGFLGALFSGFAFAGLIVTIWQQRDVIELQREDLKKQTEALKLQKEEIQQTNEELKLQREEMKAQNKTIMLQRFETTFFNMLNIQMEICNRVKYSPYSSSRITHEGRVAIKNIFLDKENIIRTKGYNAFADEIKEYMNHIFRHLIQTLKIIDTAEYLSSQEKFFYSEILSSHMTFYELASFFYYCLSDEGKATAKELAEKYALFKCLKDSKDIPRKDLSQFSNGAFTQK